MNISKYFLLVIAIGLCTATVWAGSPNSHKWFGDVSGSNLVTGANFEVRDDLFPMTMPSSTSWLSGYTILKSTGRVMLSVNSDTSACLPQNFECSVTVRITYIDNTNHQVVDTITLNVNYDKKSGKAYKEVDVYQIEQPSGVHYLKVQILSTCGATNAKYLYVRGEIEQEKYKPLLLTQRPSIDNIEVDTQNNIVITMVAGSALKETLVEYDLEWTFVEAYDGATRTGDVLDPAVTPFHLRNNTTRVTIKSLTYKISNNFEKGYLICRVRAVGRGGPGGARRTEGPWSYNTTAGNIHLESGTVYQIINPALDVPCSGSSFCSGTKYLGCGVLKIREEHGVGTGSTNLNWQYQCSYAEEGKKKESIAYYDGSLRGRQSVVRSESEGNVVVQDKIYDYQGRAAIEVLPVPTNSNALTFYPGFTRNLSGALYTAADFDKDLSGNQCASSVGEMNPAYGAAKYYSPNNAWSAASATPIAMDYVASAHNFPFIQMEFTPDNTGRPSRKSMAGIDHKLDSHHETAYDYLTPTQTELNRLFGTEVGFYENYKKNVVKDANGQYSISYLNPEEKVIATSLAGGVPAGMDTLPSSLSNVLIEEDSLMKGRNIYTSSDSTSFVGQHSFMMYESGDCKFYYSLNPRQYAPGCVSPSFCTDCIYNLDIVITDKCNVEKFHLNRKIGGGSTNTIDTVCASVSPFTFTSAGLSVDGSGFVSVNLTPGKYTITRTLSVDKNAKAAYVEKYLAAANCIPFEQFEKNAWEALDTNACNLTCEQCTTQLGTRTAFKTAKAAEFTAMGKVVTNKDTTVFGSMYDDRMRFCQRLCANKLDLCGGYEGILVADVIPGGQYAKYKTDIDGHFVADGIPNNVLGTGSGSSPNLSYKSVFTTETMWMGDTQKLIKDLTVEEFITFFDPAWAKKLITGHPEYCHLAFCRAKQSSYLFDGAMLSTETYDEAKSKGYLNPFGSFTPDWTFTTTPVITDPYFVASSADATNMFNRMKDYKHLSIEYYTDPVTHDYFYVVAASGSALKDESGNVIGSWSGSTATITSPAEVHGVLEAKNGKTVVRLNTPLVRTVSMWEIPTAAYFCSAITNDNVQLSKCIYDHRDSTEIQGCGELVKDKYWNMFRALYYANKTYLLSNAKSAIGCGPSSVPEGFVRSIDLTDDAAPEPIGDPHASTITVSGAEAHKTTALAAIASHCDEQCSSMADYWMEKLKGCNLALNSSAYTAVRNGLIAVCKNGCDLDHPLGSSTVNPAITPPPAFVSFRDVLKKALGTSPVTDLYVAGVCDDILITMPRPFDHNLFAYESAYADTCACDNRVYNGCTDTVTVPNNNCPCANAKRSRDSEVALLMGAGSGKQYACNTCIGCTQFRDAYQKFTDRYPAIQDTAANYLDLFENFMNNTLHMNMSFTDYVKFASTCMNSTVFDETVLPAFRSKFGILAGVNLTAGIYPVNLLRTGNEIMWASVERKKEVIRPFAAGNATQQYLIHLNELDQERAAVSAQDLFASIETAPMPLKASQPFVIPVEQPAAATGDGEGGSHPTTPGLDKCGCDRLFLVYKDLRDGDPGSGEPSAAAFAEAFNKAYGVDIDAAELDKMKKMCCLAANGKSTNNIDTYGEPCDIPYEVVWTESKLKSLDETVTNNPSYNLPRALLCPEACVVPLAKCGCEALMGYRADYAAAPNPKPATLAAYVASVRPDITLTDLDALLAICDKAVANGEDESAPGVWTEDGEAYLAEFVQGMGIQVPGKLCNPDYDCSTPTTPIIPYVPGQKYCYEYKSTTCEDLLAQFTALNGSPITYAMLEDYFTDNSVKENLDILMETWLTANMTPTNPKCQVVITVTRGAISCPPPATTVSPAAGMFTIIGMDISTLEYIIKYGCGCEKMTTPLECKKCLPVRPNAVICDSCVMPTRDLALAGLFLNQLVEDNINGSSVSMAGQSMLVNDFGTAKFAIHPDYPTYYATNLYGGSSASGLRYKRVEVKKFNGDRIKFNIYDGSGHTRNMYLSFAQKKIYNNLWFIRKINKIKPACTNSGSTFVIEVELDVYDPFRWKTGAGIPPQKVTAELYGSIEDVVAGELYNCCARLCNKPISKYVAIDDCKTELRKTARLNAWNSFNQYKAAQKAQFAREYDAKCKLALADETFKMKYYLREYHYTLYYYDRAGNLVKTVPPKGVEPITSSTELDDVSKARYNANATPVVPAHTFITKYEYNSLNQLIAQQTPDAGASSFYYDQLGRMVFSQNAKQVTAQKYSYTRFDLIGRITEVGELTKGSSHAINHTTSRTPGLIDVLLSSSANSAAQITLTYYDNPYGGTTGIVQENLRNRVSYSQYKEFSGSGHQYAVYYCYDIHGNVSKLTREVTALAAIGQDLKTIEYSYDLISGKVNEVVYQKGYNDQYIHQYEYDSDNRITQVFTAEKESLLERDAAYVYYKHGPLARTVLGAQKVQGIDYAYTINGWLKGVNSETLDSTRDIGTDGLPGGNQVARDEFGFMLQYYLDDYAPIGGSPATTFMASKSGSSLQAGAHNLFNGNISIMTTAIGKFMEGSKPPLATRYQYDQLNRIAAARYYNNITGNAWSSTGAGLNEWYNSFTYDADGNILTQIRRSNVSTQSYAMDSLRYEYYPGTNRLRRVRDNAATDGYFTDDINDQVDSNYVYDPIGNLIKDKAEEIDTIFWDVYGKIKRIKRVSGSLKPDLEFAYSPDGHRVLKIVMPKQAGKLNVYTYYVRDAQGNILATYERTYNRIVDYDSLTYNAVNLAILNTSNATTFASFLQANNASGLLNHIVTSLASANENNAFLAEQPLQSYITVGAATTGTFVRLLNPENVFTYLNTNITGFYPTGMLAPNGCEDGSTASGNKVVEYWLRNRQARDAFFKTLFDKDPGICQNIMVNDLGYTGWSYTMGTAEFDFLDQYYNNNPSLTRQDVINNFVNTIFPNQGISLSSTGDLEYYFGNMQSHFGFTPPELVTPASRIPDMQMLWQARTICSNGGTGSNILQAISDYNGNTIREQLLRSIYAMDDSQGQSVASALGLSTSSENAAVTDLLASSTISDYDVIGQLATTLSLTSCGDLEPLLWSLYVHYPDLYANLIANTQDILVDDHSVPVSGNTIECVFAANGYDYVDMADQTDRQAGIDLLLAVQSASTLINLFKTAQPVALLRYAINHHKEWIYGYQQTHNLYSSSGNGMKAYFTKVKEYASYGQAFHDNLVLTFYNSSNAYVDSFNIAEWMMYGSSRLGNVRVNRNLITVKMYGSVSGGEVTGGTAKTYYDNSEPDNERFDFMRGQKGYELTNHLGNVLVVVSDKILYNCTGNNYLADVTQANDYSPFGAILPGRMFTALQPEKVYLLNNTFTGSTGDFWYAGASMAADAGRLKVTTISGASRVFARVYNTIPGKYYLYTVTVDIGTAGGVRLYAKKQQSGNILDEIATMTVNQSGTYTLRFMAAGTFTDIHAEINPINQSGKVFWIDNVTVEEENLSVKLASRFGFNGKERDDEVKGFGNIIAFEARIYDPRLGRFLSLDPWEKEYPWQSPYAYFANSPIWKIDYKGMGDPPKKSDKKPEQKTAGVKPKMPVPAPKPTPQDNLQKPQQPLDPNTELHPEATLGNRLLKKAWELDKALTLPDGKGGYKKSGGFVETSKEQKNGSQETSTAENVEMRDGEGLAKLASGASVFKQSTVLVGAAQNWATKTAEVVENFGWGVTALEKTTADKLVEKVAATPDDTIYHGFDGKVTTRANFYKQLKN